MEFQADERLLNLALAGEEEAFQVLDDRYRSRVIAFAVSRGVNQPDAEDLAQRTLTKAFLELSQLRRPDRFAAWLLTIARNLVVDYLRGRRDSAGEVSRLVADRCDPTRHIEIQDEHDDLFRIAIDVLSPDQYNVLWLRYVDELEPREIAKQLGKSRVWVRVTLSRIRSRILENYLNQEKEK